MLEKFRKNQAEKQAQLEAERKARSEAFWAKYDKENPREAYLFDREWRKMLRQIEEEIKQENRNQWIQD